MCQGCSESRCYACRSQKERGGAHKLSIQEQIALFDKLNPGLFELIRENINTEKIDRDETAVLLNLLAELADS